MKKLYHYPSMLILSIIASLFFVAALLLTYVTQVMLDPKFYLDVISEYHVDEALYDEVDTYFRQYSVPTEIPQEVFMKGFDKQELARTARHIAKLSLDYILDPKAEEPKAEYDFTAFEKSVNDYYESYAEANSIEKTDEYYSYKARTISIAEDKVNSLLDVMLVYKISGTSKAKLVHRFSPFIKWAAVGSAVMLVIILIVMFIINRHHTADMPYWLGVIMFSGSGLLLIPSIYFRATGFFDGFFMTQPTVYRSFTGVIYKFIDSMIRINAVICGIAVLLIILAQIIHVVRKHKAIKEIEKERLEEE